MNGRSTPLEPVPIQPAGLCRCGCGHEVAGTFRKGHARVKLTPLAAERDCGHDTPCWVWLGTKAAAGYGEQRVGRSKELAHRWIYQAMVGEIPDGLCIDHLCAMPLCVNPAHLEVVTLAENTRRQWALRPPDPARYNREKTHCPHGHPYDEQNTVRRYGRRHCRACSARRAAA